MVYRSWHDITQEKTMNDQQNETNEAPVTDKVRNPRQRTEKSIRSLSLQEVDIALGGYEKTIRMNTESIKSKLSSGATIPPDVLRDLAIANKQKNRLILRRINLLLETGDPNVIELIDKFCKLKPIKG